MGMTKDDFFTAEDVGKILGVGPQRIRSQAKADQSKLGFPTIIIGTRLYIPKEGFERFCKGEGTCFSAGR